MPESLGQALLELSTRDTGLSRGINQAKREAQGLDRQFSTTASNIQTQFMLMTRAVRAFQATIAATAVISVVRAFAEAGIAMERLEARFVAVTGSAEGAGAEMGFVRSEAQRLGLDFQGLAGSFAGFAAAAQSTSLGLEGAREIFSAVAEAAAVFGLSTDDTRCPLLALQQMMSKGTVAAEELRGQLGERMPGAFNIAAQAMGVTTQELGKMLQAGEVLAADFLPKFARELRNSAAVQQGLSTATQTTSAAINRLTNAWTDLLAAVARSGPLDVATGIMENLARRMAGVTAEMSPMQQSQRALQAVIARLKAEAAALGTQMQAVQGQIAAATNFPGAEARVARLQGTLAGLGAEAEAVASQMRALQRASAQAFALGNVQEMDVARMPTRLPGEAIPEQVDAATSALERGRAEIAKFSAAMGSSFDASAAKVTLLRETIESLLDAGVQPGAAQIRALSNELYGLTGGAQAAEKALNDTARASQDMQRQLQQELDAFVRESHGALAADARQRAEALTQVFEQTRTPLEQFMAEVERLQALPGLDADTLGRAVGQLANDFAQGTAEFQAWNAEMARGAQLTQALLTPTELYQASIDELASLLQVGAINQETFNRGVGAAVESFNRATTETESLGLGIAQLTNQVGVQLSSSFADAVIAGESLGDMFAGLAETVSRLVLEMLLLNAIKAGLSAAFPSKPEMSLTTVPGASAGLGGVQHGASFLVGGHGGIDSQLVGFKATPGEHVQVTPPGVGMSGAQMNVVIHNYSGESIRTEKQRNGAGGMDLHVIMGEMVGGELSRSGSPASRAMRDHFGQTPRLIGR